MLEALLRLRQAACHPGLVDAGRAGEPSAKLDALLEQIASLRAEGHKALVFSQFTSLLAYRLICKDTIEEKIAELQRDKRALAESVIQADSGLVRDLTAADLEMLLS